MLIHPQFDPVALQLGPLAIHWYGITYLAAFAMFVGLARLRLTHTPYAQEVAQGTWSKQDIEDILFYGVMGVIVGGRLGYCLFYKPGYYFEHPLEVFAVWQGGMSFHGGLMGVCCALAIFAWRRRRHLLDVFDFAAALPGIGIFCGRIGNFINGELWGKPTDVPWGFLVTAPDGTALVLHASQLYEGVLEGLCLFAIVWWFSSKPRPRGAVSGVFLVVYALARILVEFVRVPDAQLGYLSGQWLTMGMVLSLPMLFIGGFLIWRAYRLEKSA